MVIKANHLLYTKAKKVDTPFSKNEICINITKISSNNFVGNFESPSFNGKGNIKLTFSPVENKIKLEMVSGKNW